MAIFTLTPLPRIGITPLPGSLLNTYVAGLSTPIATFTDSTGTVQNKNPVVADGNGLFPPIYLQVGQSYKYIATSPVTNGLPPDPTFNVGVTIWTQDGIAGIPMSSAAVDIVGTAGTLITQDQVCYLSDGSGGLNAGQWYPAKADNAYSSSSAGLVGMALFGIAAAAQGSFRIAGNDPVALPLTAGTRYYISSVTAGTLTTTAPANARYVGIADGANSLDVVANPPPATLVPGTPTDGQLIIGQTSTNGYVLNTLTAGNGFTVTNGSGTITLTPSVTLLNDSTTEQVVSNNGAPVSLYSFSVLGNLLTTTRSLRFTLTGEFINTSGSNSTLAFTTSYGGVTLNSGSLTTFATATVGAVEMVVILNANGATNSQKCVSVINSVPSGSAPGAGIWTQSGLTGICFQDTIAVDSTASQTFAVTVTLGNVATTTSFKAWMRTLELIG